MRRAGFVVALLAGACARTGLLDFGEVADEESSGGSAGMVARGGSSPSGGTRGTPDECATNRDCPVEDPCVPPTCQADTASSSGTRRCIAVPVNCDDGNVCTVDRCDRATGACVNDPSHDADGDGFLGEPPPDAPPTCGGDDCDDTDPAVHPGATELCNGRDDDCNGAIDDGFGYTNVLSAPVPIAPPERERATHGGLAWNGEHFGVSYNTTAEHKLSYFKLIDASGADASAEVPSQINADAYSGPIAWSGASFFTTFSDARQGGNYEIYATRYRADGVRVQRDQRLTDSPDFSLNPVVVWTGEEYVVAWDDRRARTNGGVPQIFARRFSAQGVRIGDETLISPVGEWGEYPALAVGERSLGFTYVSLDPIGVAHVRFRTLGFELDGASDSVELPGSAEANYPAIAFARGRFLVAWAYTTTDSLPGNAIHMAGVGETDGAPFGGNALTFGFTFARGPALVSLGDRAFLVFSGAFADGAYELHAEIIDAELDAPLEQGTLTRTAALSLFPYAAPGAPGTIGIVFDEDDETPPTSRKPYFMSVGCAISRVGRWGPGPTSGVP